MIERRPTAERRPWAPRSREIEQALRTRIATLRPGDPLPSDSALCAEFGVSRMTARSAMGRLADEGLVVRDPGRGSFVAEPVAHRRADSLLTFSREMRRQGRVPSSRLLARGLRGASADEAADLRIAPGTPVVAVRRIRCADGLPIAVEDAVLAARAEAAVAAADLERGSLHAALIAAGHVPTRGRATIGAAAATAEDAALLGIEPGAPLLVERRTILDADDVPLERTTSRYPADRYALEVAFSVEDRTGRRRGVPRTRPTSGRAAATPTGGTQA